MRIPKTHTFAPSVIVNKSNASGIRRSGKLAGLWRWFKKALPNAWKRPESGASAPPLDGSDA
jgi:hypothetical protein